MCLHDFSDYDVSRGEMIKQMAAAGALPLIGGLSSVLPAAAAENEGSAVTAFVGATVLAGDDLSPMQNATVVVKGNRIVDVGPAGSVHVPSGAKRIALQGKYVLPGLIDSHVHFFQSGGLFTRPDTIDLRKVRPYEEELAWIDAHLTDTFARYLRAGITSVSDVGGPFWNYDTRARAAQTRLAPRVAAAGPLISSVDRSILSPHGDPPILKIDTPDAARALVRREAERKTDFVKFWWIVSPDHPAQAFRPVAEAAMALSKELGLRIAVHALELETAKLAAETGTDILVHSVFDKDVDDEFVAMLKSRNIILCPTIRVLGGYETTFAMRPQLSIQDLRIANPESVSTLFMLQDIPGAETSEQRIARAKVDPAQARAAAMRNLRRLHDAGVTIAAGTDAGNIGTLHASSMYAELQTMVESGLTPKEVLITATLNGAKHMARERDLGTIAAGKIADLAVFDENPLDDVRNISSLHLVVKDGLAYRPSDLIRDTPDQLVQRHVNAFNAHNVDAMVELYAANASVVDRGTPMRTRGAIIKHFAGLFASNPDVHIKVTARSSKGPNIVLSEEISGFANGNAVKTEAAFRVSGSAITAMVSSPAP
jgi:imidazolonepropionase-like amidohydrolase